MIIKQLSVFLEDKVGRLAEMTKTLADSDINIYAFSLADAADYGIAHFIVDQKLNSGSFVIFAIGHSVES